MLTSTSQAGLLRLGVSTRAVLSTQPLRPFPRGPSVGPGGDRPSDSSKPGDRSAGGTQQETQWRTEGDRPQQRPVSPPPPPPEPQKSNLASASPSGSGTTPASASHLSMLGHTVPKTQKAWTAQVCLQQSDLPAGAKPGLHPGSLEPGFLRVEPDLDSPTAARGS